MYPLGPGAASAGGGEEGSSIKRSWGMGRELKGRRLAKAGRLVVGLQALATSSVAGANGSATRVCRAAGSSQPSEVGGALAAPGDVIAGHGMAETKQPCQPPQEQHAAMQPSHPEKTQ